MDKVSKHRHIDHLVDFITNGSAVSPNGPNDPIFRSWLRCANTHGLDPTKSRVAQYITAPGLREHQERIDEFLRVARSGMEQLYKQVASLGYVLLLSDSDGVTVDFIASPGPEKELKAAGVYLGANWNEEQMGTSGIGIAIAEKTALICHQQDHFDANYIDLSCTAAPIFDPRGELLAILNITAMVSPRAKDSQYLALQLTVMHAKAIEDANFIRHFNGQWILKLSRARAFAEISGELMLAFNDEGVIVGANTAARRELTVAGRAADWLIGRQLPDVFQCTMDDIWAAARGASLDKSLMTSDSQNLYYLAVRLPRRQKDLRIISQEKWIKEQLGPEDYAPLDSLAGDDVTMQHTLNRVKRLVDRKINILIQGETGTGKEIFARALHKSSSRSRKPFVALNCAAIPESLIESELFGYEAGAFTGGRSKGMKGVILQSDGGTLFLDEIGDMPLHLQTRLLRVLSENEVMPLGGGRPIPVDLTVIAASHRDLRTMIVDGIFREDLYYRMCGATLHLPPLRERSDIGFLIENLLKLESERMGFAALIAPDALRALKGYFWPGNIRELRNVLRYALAISDGGIIRLQDLPSEVQPSKGGDNSSLKTPIATQDSVKLEASVTEQSPVLESDALLAVLRKNKWNVTDTAAELGVCRVTIYRRMKRFRIVSPLEEF
jgi:transcriptional regulator of acetoin/glycerol metabolism